MAHNMLHDNLSCGPRSSNSRPCRRTSSRSAVSRPVNSALHHQPPVVVQHRRGEVSQPFPPSSMPLQTSPYNPHHYHNIQPHCPNVQYTPNRHVTPTFQGYHPYDYSPPMHVTHNAPMNYVSGPNAVQAPSSSGHVTPMGARGNSLCSPFHGAYSSNTPSSTLNIPSPGHLAASQLSPHMVSSPPSPITLSPWSTPSWSPRTPYIVPAVVRPHGPDPHSMIRNEQYPQRLHRDNLNDTSARHISANHDPPCCSPGRDISIVIEDPNSPIVYREKRVRTKEDSERQREDIRRLKERGGACVCCYLNKKKCDTNNPCSPCSANSRACFRDAAQLWLYTPLSDPSTKRTSRTIKEKTFEPACEVFRRLQDKSLPQAGATQAVVKLRWNDPNPMDLLKADVSELSLTDSEVYDRLKEDIIRNSLANIQLPSLQNLDSDAVDSPLLQSGMKMLGLLAALITLSRSRIYVRPADIGPARMTMFFILATHAKALCETSEIFCTELCETMRRKASHENATGGSQERDSRRLHNPVWIAAAIYHRVISGIAEFSPSPLISEILVGMKSDVNELRSKVKHILKSVPPYQDHDKPSSKSPPMEISACVPDVPVLDYFEITFWLESQGTFPVPTALGRQDAPYSVLAHYRMNSFLDENFELDMLPNVSDEVPGPRAVHLRPTLEASSFMAPKQDTMPSDAASLCEKSVKQETMAGCQTDCSGPSLPSYAGDTVVDSVFSDFTWIEQYYEGNGHAYHNNESTFDANAFFGNEDSFNSSREGIFPKISPELPTPEAASTANKARLSSDMADPRLNVAFPG